MENHFQFVADCAIRLRIMLVAKWADCHDARLCNLRRRMCNRCIMTMWQCSMTLWLYRSVDMYQFYMFFDVKFQRVVCPHPLFRMNVETFFGKNLSFQLAANIMQWLRLLDLITMCLPVIFDHRRICYVNDHKIYFSSALAAPIHRDTITSDWQVNDPR